MPTVSYGPYYQSELRALQGQRKALTGREEFAPAEMEAIVRGELGSKYAAERSRRAEQREYELALARQGLEAKRVGYEGTRLRMEGQRMRQEERAAEMAGIGEALKWSGALSPGGPALGPGTSVPGWGGPTEAISQAPATAGRTGQAAALSGTTQPGVTTTQAMSYAGRGLTLAGMLTLNPSLALAGATMSFASPVVAPLINSVYSGLVEPGGLLGPSVGGASSMMGEALESGLTTEAEAQAGMAESQSLSSFGMFGSVDTSTTAEATGGWGGGGGGGGGK
jgi:hypothetical protein